MIMGYQLVKLTGRVDTRGLHDRRETHYPTLYLPLSIDISDIWDDGLTDDMVAGERVLYGQMEISPQTKKAATRRQIGK